MHGELSYLASNIICNIGTMLRSLIALICIVIKLNVCSSFMTHNLRSINRQKLSVRNFSSSNYCGDDDVIAIQQKKDRIDGRRNFISFALVNSLAAVANAESAIAEDEEVSNTEIKNGRESSTLLRNVVGGAAVAIIIKDVTSQSYSLDSVDGIDKRDCALCKEDEEKK